MELSPARDCYSLRGHARLKDRLKQPNTPHPEVTRFFKLFSQCRKKPTLAQMASPCVRVVASARDPLVRSSQFLAGSASWLRALPERCGTSCSPTTPSSSSATGVAQSCRLPVQDEGAIVEQDLRYLSRSAAHQHADGPKNELDLTTQSRERA